MESTRVPDFLRRTAGRWLAAFGGAICVKNRRKRNKIQLQPNATRAALSKSAVALPIDNSAVGALNAIDCSGI